MSLIPHLDKWQSSPEYQQSLVEDNFVSLDKFLEVTNLLLENPNLNSSHLFRADILSDSAHILKTNAEKEVECYGQQQQHQTTTNGSLRNEIDNSVPVDAPVLDSSLTLDRTIVRRLIPRNQQLDKPLTQTCHIYICKTSKSSKVVVVYLPHVGNQAEMPWYHPPIQALAYIYDNSNSNNKDSLLCLCYLPFSTPEVTSGGGENTRLHRTFLSLLKTFIRLARSPVSSHAYEDIDQQHQQKQKPASSPSLASQLKDTILPQHLVQDTYSILKSKYAVDLISRWVEKTEPAKHVFEDLSVAAFLIELWKSMYGNKDNDHDDHMGTKPSFPGFVDIACGNGILVYILIKEGYPGFGLDARRRKTWDILGIDEHLHEQVIVPKPFLDVLDLDLDLGEGPEVKKKNSLAFHNGIFPPGTFIISNHADELSPWTPILAALASPLSPLPFLAIPCCSHALSGAKHRYPVMKANSTAAAAAVTTTTQPSSDTAEHKGDLRALRAERAKAAAFHSDDKSTYACLTRKVAAIAVECSGGGGSSQNGSGDVNGNVEMTLMRIPSTRNIGILGNRNRNRSHSDSNHHGNGNGSGNGNGGSNVESKGDDEREREKEQMILNLVHRECGGGLKASAEIWMERARQLQRGQGRGKVNLGYHTNNNPTAGVGAGTPTSSVSSTIHVL